MDANERTICTDGGSLRTPHHSAVDACGAMDANGGNAGEAGWDDRPNRARSLASLHLQLLEEINVPAVVLDGALRVVGLNRWAEETLDSHLMLRGGRLIAAHRVSHERLRAAIREVLSPERAAAGAAARAAIVTRHPKPPLLARALALCGPGLGPLPGNALLLFSCPHCQPGPDAGLLSAAFGLTPAEARLARHLASGESLADTAVRLGVSKGTVRHQLKTVFAKTETCRQSELVALLSAYRLAASESAPRSALDAAGHSRRVTTEMSPLRSR